MLVTPSLGKISLGDNVWFSLLFIMGIVTPILIWLYETGNPMSYFSLYSPPGQWMYTLSKLFALLAVGLLWLQFSLKLKAPLTHTPLVKLNHQTHKRLGLLVTVFIILHIATFVSAVSLRANHWTLNMLIPSFSGGFYKSVITLGNIAFCLLILAMLGVLLYARIGKPWLKQLHKLVILSLLLGIAHSALIGSSTGYQLSIIWYLALLSTPCFHLFFSIKRYVIQNSG